MVAVWCGPRGTVSRPKVHTSVCVTTGTISELPSTHLMGLVSTQLSRAGKVTSAARHCSGTAADITCNAVVQCS
jgi:hypothetical protein